MAVAFQVRVTQIQVRHGTHGELAPSRPWVPWPLQLAQLRVVYLYKSSLTQGETLQKTSTVFTMTNSCYLTHSLHCWQKTTHGNGLVCTSNSFRWPSGKAVWLWYSLTMTQHCMHERHNNDGCLELTTIGSSIQQTTGTWIRGCVCLPARRLDSSSNPCLLRISAVLFSASGDLPLWILTTSPGWYSPLHSSLVIRSACCSSTRTGGEWREQTGRTTTHQHPRDREHN